MGSFNLKSAFPDLATNAYDWRVDKYEPHRVWWTTRTTATHKGRLNFGGKVIEATGKVQCTLCSLGPLTCHLSGAPYGPPAERPMPGSRVTTFGCCLGARMVVFCELA